MSTAELTQTSTDRSAHWQRLFAANTPNILTIAAVVVGTLLRWTGLGIRSLWFDEGYTAWVVSRPIGEIIRLIRADTAPPLYYLILREWTIVFGRSETALRSLSAVFATLTLAIFVVLAQRVLENRWAATACVWIFSLSFMQAAYAHEARFYAMMAFLGALDLYLVLLVCDRSSPARLAALILAWTASLYTNNMMVVYLTFSSVAWLMLPGRRSIPRRLLDLSIVGAISCLAFAPWIPSMLGQMKAVRGHFWADVPDCLALERTISQMAGMNEQSLDRIGANAFLLVDIMLFGFVLLVLPKRRQRAYAAALIVFGVAPIFFIYFYSHLTRSIYMDRAFLVSSVVMPLLAVLPLVAVQARGPRFVVTAALMLLICANFWSLPTVWLGTQDENWREAIAYAVQSSARHRLVVFVANEGELFYDFYERGSDYSPGPGLVGVPSSFFAVDPPHTMRLVESDNDLNDLRSLVKLGGFDELVLIASHNWYADPEHRTLEFLQSRLPLVDQKTMTRITVFRFGAKSQKS